MSIRLEHLPPSDLLRAQAAEYASRRAESDEDRSRWSRPLAVFATAFSALAGWIVIILALRSVLQ